MLQEMAHFSKRIVTNEGTRTVWGFGDKWVMVVVRGEVKE